MKKKTMIIGLGPEYNYPGSADMWNKENTRYASNHGASLISRALIKQLNGDYIDDFKNPEDLSKKYNSCVIAFATHVTESRDVSVYTDFIDKLTIPVHIFSLGIQDYVKDGERDFKIHPSMKRLLEIVAERSKYIGVRGNYTASILYKNGFKNVRPVGCPTLFWGLTPELRINNPTEIKKPLFVFHRTMLKRGYSLVKDIKWVGQDFLDEAIFKNNPFDDNKLYDYEMGEYEKFTNTKEILEKVKNDSIFPPDFNTWFNLISTSDFVLGPRLHGCIAAIIQGIPAVMIARDLRVQEMAEMFAIPYIKYNDLGRFSLEKIINEADYSEFNKLYSRRYRNYVSILNSNNLSHNLLNNGDELFDYQSIDMDMIQRIIYNDHIVNKDRIDGMSTIIEVLKRLKERYPLLTRVIKKIV